jgi:hypothetical protein
MPGNTTGYSVGEYTRADIEIAMLALRAVLPRERDSAMTTMCPASAANLQWKLCEEAVMRLLFVDQVKRRKDRRLYVYWAGRELLPAVPVVVLERLRMFMTPNFRIPLTR